MPWPSGRIPKYRKHRASGQAVVTLAGRDHYLGPHGTKASHLEYDRLIAEWLAAGRPRLSGSDLDSPQRITIVEIIARYLTFARDYYKDSSGRTSEYRNMVDAMRPVSNLYGRFSADQFGPKAFKAVRHHLIEKGLARTTINARMRRVVRVMKWAAAEELIPASVPQSLAQVAGLKRGRSQARESPPVAPVSHEVFEATLRHLPAVVSAIARFQMLTGCRPAEACSVRPGDIERASDVWWYLPERHKTAHHGHERRIALGPSAQELLRPFLLRAAETFCFSPAESESIRRDAVHVRRRTPLSCGNVPGTNRKRAPKKAPRERYDTKSYRQAIHRACRKAGVPIWSPNQIRHTVGTEVRREFGLEASQVFLGHAAADVTQVYAQRDMELAARVARQIG